MPRLAPRKEPKQQRSAETRARILDAAARVFARHGYAAGTTNRIAEEATLSVGSLYQYFPNKDSILVELVRRHVAEGATHVAERLSAVAGRPLPERIAALVDAMVANHAGEPRLHQVLFEEAPRPPELLAELHALERDVVAAVAAALAADPTVDVPDPDLAAWVLVATVESLTHRYVSSHPDDLDPTAFAEEVTRMLVTYVGAGTFAPLAAFQEMQ
ncbi:MAG TPA: TetR/AcrR family transcriptional regulator [Acidimicrobiales bacterium]|nr:TetR/AcrR family transcriptional regulator [Acidimicrobiales bacterium]